MELSYFYKQNGGCYDSLLIHLDKSAIIYDEDEDELPTTEDEIIDDEMLITPIDFESDVFYEAMEHNIETWLVSQGVDPDDIDEYVFSGFYEQGNN